MKKNHRAETSKGAGNKVAKDAKCRPSPLASVVDELVASPGSVAVRQKPKCSLCGVPFVREQSKVFPFCSPRCQLIDLHGWFGEKFGLPVEGHEDHPAPNPDDDFE